VRILQVTPYFQPAWAYGGPPRVMTDYARGLVALGHEVDVYTTDVLDEHERARPAREVIDGVRVRRFPNVSNSLAWRTKKYLPVGLPAVLERDVARYDAVHVTDTRTFLTASAHVATLSRGVPLVLSAHGSLGRSEGLRRKVKDVYDRPFVRPMLVRSPLLLAQTPHEAAMYEELGGRPEAIKQLPLPLPPIASPRAPGSFRAQLGVSPDERLLLFLGRIAWHKGLDVLIESLEPVLGHGTTLAVVGRDDGQLAELQERFAAFFVDGRIRFAGPLYGDERFAAYADADVFCLTPRHWEETSVASLEAAAVGTAVVLTEQAELPGIEAAGGGFVVPLDHMAIRAAVEQALDDPKTLGAAAQRHVLAQHAPDTVVATLERYLLSATSTT
jgi:glycosyltransferase involved in cell wall biosynthesis